MRQPIPKSFFLILALLLISLLGLGQACQTAAIERFSKIKESMSKDEVLEIVGSPNRTEQFDGKEKWAYKYYTGDSVELKQVTFQNGAVISFGEDSAELVRIKEIQRSDETRAQKRSRSKSAAPVDMAPVVENKKASSEETKVADPKPTKRHSVEYTEIKGRKDPVKKSDDSDE